MSLQDKIKNAEETMWPLTIGMTTQKAIEHLLDIMDSMPDDACGDWRDSLAYAIDTMRKYQKIQEIIDDYEGEGWERIAISDIREVMDNGNDD